MAELNAKTIAYDRPGSVANYFGFDANNIDKLIQSYTSGDTKNAANVRKHIEGFLQRRNTTLDASRPGQRISALDYAFREEARKQQTKGSFFDKIAGFIGPAVGILTGNPYLGALAGAAAGGASGGFKGAIIGGASGGVAGYVSPGAGSLFSQGGAPLGSINQYFPADIAARAGVSKGASILGQAGAAVSRLTSSPLGQAAQGVSTGNNISRLLNPGAAAGAALLAGGAGAAAGSKGTATPASPAPTAPAKPPNLSTPSVRRASTEARQQAAASNGFEDTIATGSRGVLSRARTRRKQLLGA